MKYTSNSDLETKEIAGEIAKWIRQTHHGNVVALTGELGAGKTTFTQGFAESLGIKDKIISPTFVLQRIHKVPNSNLVLHHIDLYRLENKEDFKHLGLEELFNNPENIILIEWAEKIEKILPENTVKIKIEKIRENNRLIILE